MPSFVCDYCQETLKKAKLDQHAQRCRNACFSCIDCYKTFKGTDYRQHFSCITEVQKYHQKQQPIQNDSSSSASTSILVKASKSISTPEKKIHSCPLMNAITEIFTSKDAAAKTVSLKIVKKHLKKSIGKKAAKKIINEKIVLFLNDNGQPSIKIE